MDDDLKLGATGKFPQGKIRPEDEGEIKLAMAVNLEKKVVEIYFGKPVAWLAFPKDQAMAFAQMLVTKAAALPE